MWADSCSNEKAYMWTPGKVRASIVNVGEAVGCSVGDGEGHRVCAIVRVIDLGPE